MSLIDHKVFESIPLWSPGEDLATPTLSPEHLQSKICFPVAQNHALWEGVSRSAAWPLHAGMSHQVLRGSGLMLSRAQVDARVGYPLGVSCELGFDGEVSGDLRYRSRVVTVSMALEKYSALSNHTIGPVLWKAVSQGKYTRV